MLSNTATCDLRSFSSYNGVFYSFCRGKVPNFPIFATSFAYERLVKRQNSNGYIDAQRIQKWIFHKTIFFRVGVPCLNFLVLKGISLKRSLTCIKRVQYIVWYGATLLVKSLLKIEKWHEMTQFRFFDLPNQGTHDLDPKPSLAGACSNLNWAFSYFSHFTSRNSYTRVVNPGRIYPGVTVLGV